MVLGRNMAEKHTAQGKIPENGLSSLENISGETLKSLGMASVGPDQKPEGIVHKSISTDRGKFEFA